MKYKFGQCADEKQRTPQNVMRKDGGIVIRRASGIVLHYRVWSSKGKVRNNKQMKLLNGGLHVHSCMNQMLIQGKFAIKAPQALYVATYGSNGSGWVKFFMTRDRVCDTTCVTSPRLLP